MQLPRDPQFDNHYKKFSLQCPVVAVGMGILEINVGRTVKRSWNVWIWLGLNECSQNSSNSIRKTVTTKQLSICERGTVIKQLIYTEALNLRNQQQIKIVLVMFAPVVKTGWESWGCFWFRCDI